MTKDILKKEIERFDEGFSKIVSVIDGDKMGFPNFISICKVRARANIKDFIIQSHINLLEADIKRLEGKIVGATDSDNGYETGVTKTGDRLTHNQKFGYNLAIQEEIDHKIEEINSLR